MPRHIRDDLRIHPNLHYAYSAEPLRSYPRVQRLHGALAVCVLPPPTPQHHRTHGLSEPERFGPGSGRCGWPSAGYGMVRYRGIVEYHKGRVCGILVRFSF